MKEVLLPLFTAVKTEGVSTNLFQTSSAELHTKREKPDDSDRQEMEQLLASAIGEEQDEIAKEWSNESLASNSSIGRVELLEMSESDILDEVNYVEGSINESGSGEGLSEYNLEDSSSTTSGSLSQSWKVVHSASVVKPPNVLIYTGKIDSVRKFEKVKKVLEQCLDNECYVIYHLKHEDIQTTPWTDNTSLLVLASKRHYQDANSAFMSFFMNGGKIIGFGSGLDTEFLGQSMVRSETWLTQVTYKTWTNVSLISGIYVYNVNEVKVDGCRATTIAVDKDDNALIVKVAMDIKGSSGCAVLSQVSN